MRSKSWDGNASDTQSFQERAPALLATLRESPRPRSLVADATLSTEDTAPNLAKLGCITRIPGTLKRVTPVLPQARREAPWQPLEAMTRSQRMAWCHYGMAQRWLVVWSQASRERAEASGNTAYPREAEAMHNPLLPLPARRVDTPPQAPEAWAGLAKTWRSHQGASFALLDHQRYGKTGRPTAASPLQAIAWPLQAHVRPHVERIAAAKPPAAGCVVGTNIETDQRSEAEVIAGDTAPSQAEGGGAFSQPRCCSSRHGLSKPRAAVRDSCG